MDLQKAYDTWAAQYDNDSNKTRDLEAVALRKILSDVTFQSCLEIGCGTGKNTEWFLTKAKNLVAIDLSAEMINKAKEKIGTDHVKFLHADITKEWTFIQNKYDLISFSLILEHIENLDPIFYNASQALNPGGYVYIGELHPYKQYMGTKATFENEGGMNILTCFNHHLSDFTNAAESNGLELLKIYEFFDEIDEKEIPRILSLIFRKK